MTTIEPCDLADAATREDLELAEPAAKTIGEARVCRFRRTGQTLTDSFTVSVEIFESRGIGEIIADDVRELPAIGGHRAVMFTGPAGGCRVGLGVTETSRVDLAAVGGEQELGCRLVEQLARRIEPTLP